MAKKRVGGSERGGEERERGECERAIDRKTDTVRETERKRDRHEVEKQMQLETHKLKLRHHKLNQT